MNSPVETLNVWADHALRFAWPMLWQSTLLIGVLFALNLMQILYWWHPLLWLANASIRRVREEAHCTIWTSWNRSWRMWAPCVSKMRRSTRRCTMASCFTKWAAEIGV